MSKFRGNTRNVAAEILNPHVKQRHMRYFADRNEHFRLLGKPLSGLDEIIDFLPEEHIYVLEQYGAWMEALVSRKIKPLTEAQKTFIHAANGGRSVNTKFGHASEEEQNLILEYAPTSFWGIRTKRFPTEHAYPNLGVTEIENLKLFKKAWANSDVLRNTIQTKPIKKEQPLSTRNTNVNSITNYQPRNNQNLNAEGGFGFITGIILAVLAFSIVPVIPVILAFFAGHWLNYTFGNK